MFLSEIAVATHMGGVSWNRWPVLMLYRLVHVATHMGGVSWNFEGNWQFTYCGQSPPTWVVWVEISLWLVGLNDNCVAALMGGVSWNLFLWLRLTGTVVAALMGGVSWNFEICRDCTAWFGRRPYGWRELKSRTVEKSSLPWYSRRPYGWRELKYNAYNT